ncbi:MAG: cyclic nucleotide-binding domain-containing protein [Actinomycetota bacterium]|nr:cyclic nucleotide-binding domain-containing protein [Actinomycetota bacterium]
MVRFLDAPINHSLVRALRRVPDFSAADDQVLLRIVGASANLAWPKGSLIFEADSPSEALYIVLSGEVRIFEGNGEGGADVARIGPGDFFGELSLLRQELHSKSAQALSDCELMVLPKKSFTALLEADPEIDRQVREKRAQVAGPRLS